MCDVFCSLVFPADTCFIHRFTRDTRGTGNTWRTGHKARHGREQKGNPGHKQPGLSKGRDKHKGILLLCALCVRHEFLAPSGLPSAIQNAGGAWMDGRLCLESVLDEDDAAYEYRLITVDPITGKATLWRKTDYTQITTGDCSDTSLWEKVY